jgi:hypothetical protein
MFARAERLACTVEVEHTSDNLYAHVLLDGDPEIRPGDQVHVEGEPIAVPFGERRSFRRTASLRRASLLERFWTRLSARLELSELYEVSFTSGRRL